MGLDHVASKADQRCRLVRVPHAALNRVRVVEEAARVVVDGDVDDLCVEDLLELVADDVVDRLRIELARDRLLDAVDECQLGVALPRLLDRTGPGESRADVLADERQQVLVLLRVLDGLRVRLHHEPAHRAALGAEWDPEPAGIFGDRPRELDLALLDQLDLSLVRK
jgi:hypothetical protein